MYILGNNQINEKVTEKVTEKEMIANKDTVKNLFDSNLFNFSTLSLLL